MSLLQMLFLGLQSTNKIEEKLQHAPDKGYEIGIVIGTYLPFVVFILFAYYIYYKARNKKD